MAYADNTFNDRNPVKRWLQRRRLTSAIELCHEVDREPVAICDYGAGDGELCKCLADRFPQATITCFEPVLDQMHEAQSNLRGTDKIVFHDDMGTLPRVAYDIVTCLEVFEHLPPAETDAALKTIVDVLKPDGIAIIGVPVETGIPAAYKGVFRMLRRFGAYDAKPAHVALAVCGRPPTDRPAAQLGSGSMFYHEHMGFRIRDFRQTLGAYLSVRRITASPFSRMGLMLMPEVYFVARKR